MHHRAALASLDAEDEVLLDGQRRGKHGAILGDVTDAPMCDLERLEAGNGFILEDLRTLPMIAFKVVERPTPLRPRT